MNTYRTQLFTNGLWQQELSIEARAVYVAAEEAMRKHVIEDPTMCGAEWSIRVELEYTSGKKYWDQSTFELEIILHNLDQ